MSKYNDIVDYIMEEISNRNIDFGQKLPTVRELSQKFQCSKTTVVRAYDELQRNHIVYSIPQSGYYLVENKNVLHKGYEEDMINFCSATLDKSVLPYEEFQHCLNQAIDVYKENLFNYSDPKGLPSLINILLEHFEQYQIFCNSDNIFITAGSQQSINILCSMPFPNGKSNVLVEQPTYNGILKSLELSDIPVVGIERRLDGIDLNELERKFANNNIKCFYTIPRFHNPLGVSYSNEEKKYILKLAQKYDVYIIEDDYLADLDIKNNAYPIYYHDVTSRVIYVKSFSKILLPGLRIAALVVPKILINTFAEYKRWSDLGTSVLSQGALEIYIKSGMFEAHGRKIKKIYLERMKALKREALSVNVPHIKWHIPDTGFYACIEFLENVSVDDIIKRVNYRNIYVDNMKKNYLKEYLDNRLLKISISRSGLDKIKCGIPILINEIAKVKEKDKFNKNIFDI